MLSIHATASISPDARINPSSRGSLIQIGAHSQVFEFVVISAIGGSGDIVIGEHCYINPHSVLYSGSGIRLGNYVLIGPGCMLVPSNHAYSESNIPIRHQGFLPPKGGIVIENDVWIGANCTLLDGCHIESGCVIAAGSLVRGRVGGNAVWGGNPLTRIRGREPAS